MTEVLKGLLIAGAAFWAMVVLAAVWVRHRLRRHLRITPAVRSAAPTRFVWSPVPAARLHRRLRRVGRTARLAATIDPALVLVADDVVAEALALEPRVLATARTGRAGVLVRRDLSLRIADLETAGRRLHTLSTEPTSPSPGRNVDDRLTALEAARRELTEIERRAGLLHHA